TKISKPDFESVKLIESQQQDSLNENPENPTIDSSSNSNLRRSERIKKLPSKDYMHMNDPDSFLSLVSANLLPSSFNDVFNRTDTDKWLKAIQSEIESLRNNKTWDLVEIPNNVNIVSCKWVFTIKNNESGEPTRYKARLVARGFTQEYLQDYDETFAPVARMTTFRFILALANQFDLLLHHMDVKTAFLNGILKEDIYMEVPEGIIAKDNK
ncbi:jg24904, partial [Pararge aegeria aegeria]